MLPYTSSRAPLPGGDGQQRLTSVALLPAALSRQAACATHLLGAGTQCPCGCGKMVRIGEDVSERLKVIPAQFRALVTRRPKYACRRCSQAVAKAPEPEHVVPGGLPAEPFIARQGMYPDRGAPGNRVGRACFHLMPVIDHMRHHLRSATRILVDETRAPVPDPGRERTKNGFFRGAVSLIIAVMAVLTRPLVCSITPLAAANGIRRGSLPDAGRFLQCDGQGACNALAEIDRESGPWQRVHCRTHVRRRFAAGRERWRADHRRAEALARSPAVGIPAKSRPAADIGDTLGPWPGLTRLLHGERRAIAPPTSRRVDNGMPVRELSTDTGIRACLTTPDNAPADRAMLPKPA